MQRKNNVSPLDVPRDTPQASQRMDVEMECLCGRQKPFVVARQERALLVIPEEGHRSQVKGIERSDRCRKRIQRTREDRRDQFEKSDATEQSANEIGMAVGQSPRVDSRPHLVLQKPA